jgi:hypothetical protein
VVTKDVAGDFPVDVLVDFQNVIPGGRSPRSPLEVQWLLAGLVRAAVISVRHLYPSCRECRLHLYGGWTGHDARATRHAQWLRTEVAFGRTRHEGVRVLPRLVTSLQCAPSVVLVGTSRRRNDAAGMQQKMVDCMLALDAMHMATHTADPVIVWTDDDDLVPAAISVAAARGSCHVWRRRQRGSGLNDHLLEGSGVNFCEVEVLGDF